MTEPEIHAAASEYAVEREQLRLLATQASRTLAPLMLADLFLLWILHTIAEGTLGLVWFVTVTLLQFVRRRYAMSLLANLPAANQIKGIWRRLDGLFLLIGCLRAALVPLSFQHHDATAKYFVCMMLISLAAGGIASVAGNIRPFLMWAGPIFAALMVGWILEGGVEGYVFAFLVAVMLVFILAAVRDQHRVLIETMNIREQNQSLLASLGAERDRARAASEAKTRFFAAASHDLRQPLHAMSLHAATLDLIATDDRTRRVSTQLNRSLTHANSLLEGLIDLSRLDAKAITPAIKAFPLSDLLRSLETEFGLDCASRNLSLTFDQEPAAMWVLSDPDLVLRIFRNLVGNALKFTDQGGIAVKVRALDNNRILISVSDTGIGIPAEEQQRIFEEFYQLGNPGRDRSKGLGLGLSIVQRLCDMLALQLSVSSTPGIGSRFDVELTRAEPEREESARPEARRDYALSALRVLLVDDEEMILNAVGDFLNTIGWACATASDGARARQIVREGFMPDILVLDVRLGEASGVDLALELRREHGPVPVLFVTGESDPAKIEAIKQTGFAFVAKPVDGAQLAEAISNVVRQHEGKHEAQS